MTKSHTLDPLDLLPLTPAVFSILLALAGSEKHGYAIMKEAAEPEGGGVTMGPGTLYGSLDRMMHSGLIEETGLTDNERRRYYRITRFGSQVLTAEASRLARMMSAARPKLSLEGERRKAVSRGARKTVLEGGRL
jgi:DNA-binding PadR family transcriptional regulator